jgi:hypothetical protein
MHNRRGFAPLIILLIVAAIFAAGAVEYYSYPRLHPELKNSTGSTSIPLEPTPSSTIRTPSSSLANSSSGKISAAASQPTPSSSPSISPIIEQCQAQSLTAYACYQLAKTEIAKANYCEITSDCRMIPSMVFGCGSAIVNKSEFSRIQKLIVDLQVAYPTFRSLADCADANPAPICTGNRCGYAPFGK